MDSQPNGPSGEATLATEWLMWSIAVCLLLTRLYVRLMILRKSLILSDYLIICGVLISCSHIICIRLLYEAGVLRGDVTIDNAPFPNDPDAVIYILKIYYANVYLFHSGLYFSKFAILAFIHTIFPSQLRTLRIALYCVTALTVSCYLASIGISIAFCLPISENWSLDPTSCRTTANRDLFLTSWSLNFPTDLAIFALPFLMFRKLLELPKREKIGLAVIFSLGLIIIGITIGRFISIMTTKTTSTEIFLWSSMDIAVGLIVACLPTLKPLLRKIPKVKSESSYPDTMERKSDTPSLPSTIGGKLQAQTLTSSV